MGYVHELEDYAHPWDVTDYECYIFGLLEMYDVDRRFFPTYYMAAQLWLKLDGADPHDTGFTPLPFLEHYFCVCINGAGEEQQISDSTFRKIFTMRERPSDIHVALDLLKISSDNA